MYHRLSLNRKGFIFVKAKRNTTQMTFRWYGKGNDRIKLSDIKQIPGVKGIVWALHDKMPSEVWEESEINVGALRTQTLEE